MRFSQPGDEIRVAAGVYTSSDSAVLTIRNTALTIAGGYAEGDWVTPRATNSVVIDAQGARRGVAIEGAAVLLQDLVIQNGVAGSPDSFQQGAGIYAAQNQQGIVILDGVTLQNNSASGSGGGAASDGPLEVYSSLVLGNRAGEDGGGLWSPDIEIYGGELRDNWAGRSGGAAISVTVIEGASFIGNQARIGSGGAVELGLGATRVVGARFENNRAGDVGGALYHPFTVGSGSLDVSNSLFLGNQAVPSPGDDTERGWRGGAIAVDGFSSAVSLTVNDSRFEGNVAQYTGGAIVQTGYDGSITVSRSSFLNNQAVIGSSGAVGFSVKGALSDVDFIGNRAGTFGGALAQFTPENATVGKNPLVVDAGRFIDNSAGGDGGAIYSREGLTLTRATLSDNQAGGSGGAVAIPAILEGPQKIIINNSQLRGNRATGEGGALMVGGDIHMRSTSILANTAGDAGGAIRVLGYGLGSSQLTMTGVILGNNRGGSKADGIWAELSRLFMRNVTIASALPAPHAAVAVLRNNEPLTVTLENTTISGHAIGLDRIADMALAGDYNNFFGNGQNQLVDGAAAPLPWAHGLSVAPKFVDPAGHNFRLRADSPLLEAGHPATSYSGQFDVDGQRVPIYARADIGGDEFMSFTSRVYLPQIAKPLVR
jgi:predicted outer membrane repeat protein